MKGYRIGGCTNIYVEKCQKKHAVGDIVVTPIFFPYEIENNDEAYDLKIDSLPL